jgi:hypothetical protein
MSRNWQYVLVMLAAEALMRAQRLITFNKHQFVYIIMC